MDCLFYGSDSALYLRSLESVAVRKLEGTDGAGSPFLVSASGR